MNFDENLLGVTTIAVNAIPSNPTSILIVIISFKNVHNLQLQLI